MTLFGIQINLMEEGYIAIIQKFKKPKKVLDLSISKMMLDPEIDPWKKKTLNQEKYLWN